ncbi:MULTISPECIES: transglutaminase TgpA family protein [unclassified Cupriavidus]|uniref:transglutaminase TgpA family protein n=1 Tax=unclassified Cupriavidus TaxID=2640874 RepID=UPI00313B8811
MTTARLRPLAHQEHGMLMGQLALVLAPQARTLPVSVSLLLVVLMAWRWLLWRQRAPLPSRTMLAVIAMLVLATAAALVWQAGGSLGRDLCVALLGAFVILKLLECRALSDATMVTQLSFYLLLTLYLSDQPFWLALYSMAIGAWVLRNWLLLHHPEARGRLAIWPLLGRMALIGLPWALFLFVLFPRLDHPLWRLPQSESTGKTGITDTMRPGSIGELIRSTEIAFRADMAGDPLPPSALYWRALVLWRYDGQQWRTLEQQRLMRAAPALRDDALDAAAPPGMRDYSVTLEASQQSWLYLLDRGVALSGMPEARISYDGEFFARAPIDRPVRYRARSAFDRGTEPPATLPPRIRALALELPDGNPRSRALAARWAEQFPDPWQRVQAALRVFAGEAFYYTLSPPPLGSQQVDSFVFDTHRGFCEHYSSSFVFLMRAAGVPARVVTGYQGGEYNTIGRHYIVRQSDAHAWAEVWIDGRGWVRVDPTSAVAPSRVEQGVDAALAGDEADAVRSLRAPGWLRDLRWGLDGLMYTWQRWILDYDRARQMSLLRQFGMDDRLPQILMVGLAALTLLGLIPLWLRRQRLDPLQALYARFCRELAKRGYERGAAEGPQDYARRAAAAMPQAAPALHAFTAEYVRLRYGAPPAVGRGSLAALHRALRDVIRSLRQR